MSENNPTAITNATFEYHDKLKQITAEFEQKTGTSIKAIILSREEGKDSDELQLQISYFEKEVDGSASS